MSFYIIEFKIVQKTQIFFMDLSKSLKPAKMHGWLNYVRAVIDIKVNTRTQKCAVSGTLSVDQHRVKLSKLYCNLSLGSKVKPQYVSSL